MVDYDLTTSTGQQQFQNWVDRTIKNEINSYVRQVLGGSGAGSTSTGISTSATSTGAIGNDNVPSGIILPYAGGPGLTTTGTTTTFTDIPEGWLLCFGQAISRISYATLFRIIGTHYGAGDGTTTFNLPDLRGRTAFGRDVDMTASGGTGLTNRITNGVSGIVGTGLGATGGNEALHNHSHTYSGTTGDDFPDHIHNFNPRVGCGWNSGTIQLVINGGTQYWGLRSNSNTSDGGNTGPTYGAASRHQHNFSGTTTGPTFGGASQNMPPAIIMNYIIKT